MDLSRSRREQNAIKRSCRDRSQLFLFGKKESDAIRFRALAVALRYRTFFRSSARRETPRVAPRDKQRRTCNVLITQRPESNYINCGGRLITRVSDRPPLRRRRRLISLLVNLVVGLRGRNLTRGIDFLEFSDGSRACVRFATARRYAPICTLCRSTRFSQKSKISANVLKRDKLPHLLALNDNIIYERSTLAFEGNGRKFP